MLWNFYLKIQCVGQQIILYVQCTFLHRSMICWKKTVMNIMFLHCPWVSNLFDVLDKIGTANLYFYEPKVRPDKHHLLTILWLLKKWKWPTKPCRQADEFYQLPALIYKLAIGNGIIIHITFLFTLFWVHLSRVSLDRIRTVIYDLTFFQVIPEKLFCRCDK